LVAGLSVPFGLGLALGAHGVSWLLGALGVFLVALAPTWVAPDLGILGIWAALAIWMGARASGMHLAWRST
jgi:hypothetical protein